MSGVGGHEEVMFECVCVCVRVCAQHEEEVGGLLLYRECRRWWANTNYMVDLLGEWSRNVCRRATGLPGDNQSPSFITAADASSTPTPQTVAVKPFRHVRQTATLKTSKYKRFKQSRCGCGWGRELWDACICTCIII
jgi:hypothetical protein